MSNYEGWLTTREAAAYVRLSPNTIRAAAKDGGLRSVRLSSPGGMGRLRFTTGDLDAWMSKKARRRSA